ncbi:MAG: hypothetical protein E7632_10955 [Ruminococcaceae bacterium]|nr:hypothetical protein [Oscillospiraceae bacterium]
MKKRISLILLAALLALQAASCGESEGADVTDDTTAALTESTKPPMEIKTFGGKTFRVMGTNGAMPNFPEEEENGDKINDTMYVRDRHIEETHDVVIEYVVEGSGTSTNTFKNSILAQEEEYSMLADAATQICKISAEGVLADIASMPYITLDSNHWSRLMAENCQLGGKLYILCGDILPVIYTIPSCLFMNTNLADDYQIKPEDVYDLVLDGKWTFDRLISYTRDVTHDLNQDSVIKTTDDFYGYLTEAGTLPAGLLAVAADINLCDYTADGELTVNLMTEKMLALIEKLKPLTANVADGGDVFHAAFTSDRALFSQHYTSSAYTRYRDMASDFAILPVPKYDEAQDQYRSLMNPWGAAFVGFPSNGDAEFIGYIAEAMAVYSYENLRGAVYEEAFKLKGARDDTSAQMLDLIFNNLYLDNNAIYDIGTSTYVLSQAMFYGGNFASDWASIEAKIKADIDKIS